MAIIPDKRSIGQRSISMRQPALLRGASRVENKLEGLGTAVTSVGRNIQAVEDKRDRRAYDKARADFRVQQIEQSNSFRDRNDYGNFDAELSESLTEAQSKYAETISDPALREAFVNDTNVSIASSRETVSRIAWEREVDSEIAGNIERSAKLREAFINAPDVETIQGVINDHHALLQSSFDSGYIDEDTMQSELQKWQLDSAKGRLATMDPEDQLTALKEDWVKNIPTDERVGLERRAKTLVRANRAVKTVDGMFANGKDPSEAEGLDAIAKKYQNNAELRKAAEDRFRNVRASKDRAEAENQYDVHNKWHLELGPGGDATYADVVASGDDVDMTPGQRENLMSLERSKASPRSQSDPNVEIMLTQLASEASRNGDWSKYHKYFTENSSRLTSTDQVTYATKLIEGQIPPALDSQMSNVQAVRGALGKNYDQDKAAFLLSELGRWRMKSQLPDPKTGRPATEPTDLDRDSFLYSKYLEYDTTPGGAWYDVTRFGGTKPVADMTPDETSEVLNNMRTRNPELYKLTEDEFRAKGIVATPSMIMEAFTAMESVGATRAAE